MCFMCKITNTVGICTNSLALTSTLSYLMLPSVNYTKQLNLHAKVNRQREVFRFTYITLCLNCTSTKENFPVCFPSYLCECRWYEQDLKKDEMLRKDSKTKKFPEQSKGYECMMNNNLIQGYLKYTLCS